MLTAEISRTRCRGIETNAIHFCTLISASDAQGDWQLAVDLFPGGNELSTGFAQLDFTHLISLASNVMNGVLASQSWLESPSEFGDTSSGIQKASPDVFGMAALFSCDFALPILSVIDVSNKTTLPIGSMYAIYGNIYHQNTPVMLAYMVPSSVSPPPPHGLGPQVVAPIPFYLQAIGSISEVQLRIC